MQPNPSCPSSAAACPLTQAFDLPKSSSSGSSFRPFSKLFRTKSGPSRSNQSASSELVDASRTEFLPFLSAPPTPTFPPTPYSCSFKNGERKSSASADLFSQSLHPGAACRARSLCHSLSAPNFWPGDSSSSHPLETMANLSLRSSPLSVITQDISGGRALDAEADNMPLVSPKCSRKIWNAKWTQRTIFRSKSMISSSSYPTANCSTSTFGSVQGASLRCESTQPTILYVEPPNLIPPLSSSSLSLTADDLPRTPSPFSESTLSFQSQQTAVRGRGSIAKLARTLGVLPGELDYPAAFGESPASAGFAKDSFSEGLGTHPRAPGRMSLSLSSFSPLSFFRFSSQHSRRAFASIPTPSHSLVPTKSTEELQEFTFANNLTNPYTSTSYDSPISPITFEPTTSTIMGPTQLPSGEMKHQRGVQKDPSRGVVTSPASSLTRARTLYRIDSRSSFAAKPRGDTPFEDLLPEKANWLDEASPMVDRTPSNLKHKLSKRTSDSTRTHSGQWNQDDMQYVIKSLRRLK